MNDATREEVIHCLRRNIDIFAWTPQDLEGIDPKVITHHLKIIPQVKPVKQKKRHFGPEKDKIIQAEVDKLMAVGHIEVIQFQSGCPMWSWCPNRGKWRMCIDFRDLNKAFPKDFYPLPKIDHLVDSTSGCDLLSMMDASRGYHQIRLALENRIEANPIKIKVILDMKAPSNVKEVLSTLSRFISKAVEKSLPFFKRKAKNFEWDDSCQQVFKEFCGAPPAGQTSSGKHPLSVPLCHPQTVSSVLIWEEGGKHMTIYYVSKVLNGAEGRYTPIEKMALALIVTARGLSPYFLSHPVGVKTNMPLKQTFDKPDTSGRLVKWVVELSEYDITYLPRTTIKAQPLVDLVSEIPLTIKQNMKP
ncbi:UNVERIFIED_CONTAM: hypothetical protein Slati_3755700 [Sesamum latifolium]|uniref:Reverse transcriptase RNase H-like domain-containing protein n=1 Tax=Sesamum latifolium TaxID=2727402 RepID=A0AAW2U5R9_9LAMI